ncbi:peptidoglycan recognition family protein [Paraburkholderia tagetis]|uniref:Peptidoglycan recognition protein family protein n=1 Tax=Paraburkholderia tagetis TaxID=2913261 RepID=A0A9X1RU76_9BURK|nr:peptidoglycan recognition family protein [Paraburkholderia tagetis]MCG5075947.1 peptidoglycan recognition protein family protein [Paraburkholderia tagetis]
MADYDGSNFWTSSATEIDGSKQNAIAISIDDRAATRQAIVSALARKGYRLIERSAWHAKPPRGVMRESHWDYQDIVIHHAGRSYSCGVPSIEEIQRVQTEDMGRNPPFDDAGYHYAVSCQGEVYEARDIRFLGEHVAGSNSGKIGIVFLSDLVEAGEAYEQEYSRLSIFDKFKNFRGIITDWAIFKHDKPTTVQIQAATALCEILKDFFNISRLGGHREYQKLATNTGRACPGNLGMDIVKLLRSRLSLSAPGK